MLIHEDGDDIERADQYVAVHGASYHACSGDSYCVQQYLEWCDYARIGNNQDRTSFGISCREGALDAEVTFHAGLAVDVTRRGDK